MLIEGVVVAEEDHRAAEKPLIDRYQLGVVQQEETRWQSVIGPFRCSDFCFTRAMQYSRTP